ncbi:MAG: lycopene cyclase family protein [Caldilinea sp.]|nr:lycopene cyclase family protein [Caldilinea sp.]MDW8440790.1 lycopene cyclase family protein [Caldilineaceae bacterium]
MKADVLVIGAGPAGLALAAALCDAGLCVGGVAPTDPTTPWSNTYGIWEDELPSPEYTALLGHRWSDCTSYVGGQALRLERVYGLFDNARLQEHLLERCLRAGMRWRRGSARLVEFTARRAEITLEDGGLMQAQLVVDASGHTPVFVRRPLSSEIAYQAAYGVVGAFTRPPVRPGQLVLMDYRSDHLTAKERRTEPPTFLYAMDLGNDRYFVEETSLAHVPAVPFALLKTRLHRRLAHMGCAVAEAEHEEYCLFPMNMPVPYLDQPVLGYGGAASMVHPASGYQVGAALRLAAPLAQTIAHALAAPNASPSAVARAGWKTLWPQERLRKHQLYLFGLRTLLSLNEAQLQQFFAAFFHLPVRYWGGYLSNTLTTAEIIQTMAYVFMTAPMPLRLVLIREALRHPDFLLHAVGVQSSHSKILHIFR